jgi:hypothetical protein
LYANPASSDASLVVDDLRILCGVATQAPELLTLRAGDEAGEAVEAEPEESPLEQDAALTATTELPAHEPRTVDEAPTGAGETRLNELPIGDPHDGIEAVLDAGSLQNAEGIPTIWEKGKYTAPQETPASEPLADDEAAGEESPVVDDLDENEEEGIDPTAIVPPPDLSGPGSAFSTGANALDDVTDEDEQARRLAGFLVSEIKLYNKERLRDALASGGVYAALEEDIELARGIYDDCTDADLRSSPSYFDDEVLRVLADRDPSILGV